MIQVHCERVSACGCGGDVQPQGCGDELSERWSARMRNATRMNLTYDAECFEGLSPIIEDYRCYWPGGTNPLCVDFCAVYHGDKLLGEECESFDTLVSDCAQGLMCHQGACAEPCPALSGRQLGEQCGNEGEAYDDCAQGLSCDWQIGRCVTLPEVGELCNGGSDSCGPGLVCSWQTGLCAAAATSGQSCQDTECDDGLYCDWREGTGGKGEQICVPFVSEGQSCDNAQCGEGLRCNEQRVCTLPPGPGQLCLWGSECNEDAVCNFDTGLCLALPEAGASCINNSCADGTWCQTTPEDPDGTCSLPVASGEMCSGHSQCDSRYCPNGFCQDRPGDGEDCMLVGICAAGLVCNGQRCEPTLTRAPAACSYPGW